MNPQYSTFSLDGLTLEQICHVTSSDILVIAKEQDGTSQVVLINTDNENQQPIKSKFKIGLINGQPRDIFLVSSNGGDKVYIYDSEEVLYLWNPHTNQTVARSMVQKVKCIRYASE